MKSRCPPHAHIQFDSAPNIFTNKNDFQMKKIVLDQQRKVTYEVEMLLDRIDWTNKSNVHSQ